MSAWRKLKREAEASPRKTSGRIRLLQYDLEYVDLLSTCPQWHDLFVRQSLRVELPSATPYILDCGAHVGLASLYFKRIFPGARIRAFEADPGIAEKLRGNLDRNGHGDVVVENAAVWIEDGTVEFFREGSDSGTLSAFASGLEGEPVRVPSRRLKHVLDEAPVDLLKLDIEGAEADVLRDCVGSLGNVRALLMDLHEFDPRQRRTANVLDVLTSAGFAWSLDDLSPLPWRPPIASSDTPFAGTHLTWCALVRAWRDEPRER